MSDNNALSMQDVKNNPLLSNKVGGKFNGLLEVADIIEELNQELGVKVEMPKTFVLSTDAFNKISFDADNKPQIPEEIVNDAMRSLVACGGNVAVRSSASVEDVGGKTNSGAFDSVLNVQSKADMIKALEQVYGSLYNPEVLANHDKKDLKMAVLIQKMIPSPEVAGVTYSEDFAGDAYVVMNCVNNKTADKLVMAQDNGKVLKCSKFVTGAVNMETGDTTIHRLTADVLRRSDSEEFFCHRTDNKNEAMRHQLNKSDNDIPNLSALFNMTVIANKMEEKLGRPVDVEFAVSKDKDGNDLISILQQRAYISPNNFKIVSHANGDLSGYPKNDSGIIEGQVLTTDITLNMKPEELDGKILISKLSKSRSDFDSDRDFQEYKLDSFLSNVTTMQEIKSEYTPKLRIDNSGIISNILYGHYGNQLRESNQPFFMTNDKSAFADINNGDKIRIDLNTGSYKILPKENEKLKTAVMGKLSQQR